MKSKRLQGKIVLVTGASSGLGAEIARVIAVEYGADLILVARRKERMESLKKDLANVSDSKIYVLKADLSKEEEVDMVVSQALSYPNLYGVILNAGITYFGLHKNMEAGLHKKIMDLNVNAVVKMAEGFFQKFDKGTKEYRIMVVSSLASLVPVPYQSLYSGTKGFVTNFFNALSQETHNPHLKLIAFCPGGIKTEMTSGDSFSGLSKYLDSAGKVAKSAVDAFYRGDVLRVPGLLNKVTLLLSRLLPRKVILAQAAKMYRKALGMD